MIWVSMLLLFWSIIFVTFCCVPTTLIRSQLITANCKFHSKNVGWSFLSCVELTAGSTQYVAGWSLTIVSLLHSLGHTYHWHTRETETREWRPPGNKKIYLHIIGCRSECVRWLSVLAWCPLVSVACSSVWPQPGQCGARSVLSPPCPTPPPLFVFTLSSSWSSSVTHSSWGNPFHLAHLNDCIVLPIMDL